jgi:CHAT domain-containing protein
VLALCLDESRRKGAAPEEKILAVGNPMFNHEKFNLVEIPEAEQEAIESAGLYDSANREVLIGASATKQNVRAALPNCDIAHLALHCLVNEKTPFLAALVLADPNQNQTPDDQEAAPITPGAQDDSLLYLNDIYSLSLPRTRLVILSACNSALGQYYRGEGIVSLVRPFLALRVPTVIASLWSVNSQATAALMIDFHRERKGNNTGAGDALRAAQRRMVRSSSYQHPIYWAAFMVVGSNA